MDFGDVGVAIAVIVKNRGWRSLWRWVFLRALGRG
jgi:hypothetical protein